MISTVILGAIGSIVAAILIWMFNATIARMLKKPKTFIINYFHKFGKNKKKVKSKKGTADNDTNNTGNDSLTSVVYTTTDFFHYRLTDAFPSLEYGVHIFTDKRKIIKRLKILLAEPLFFSTSYVAGYDSTPIWWFRGAGNLNIEKFQVLNRRKVLINIDEYIINKLIVYKSKYFYRDFIYVECEPDKAAGVYKNKEEYMEYINRNIQNFGYCQEEFGIWRKRLITRKEYDEGSALIKRKPVRLNGAEPRTRFLTKYNFIIAAKYSPYNSNIFDRYSDAYFNNLLTGEIDFDEFLDWMLTLDRNQIDMECL